MKTIARLFALAALGATAFAAPALAQAPQKVRIATEGAFRPWNWTEADGTLAGFEIDLYKDLCKRAGLDCSIEAQAFDGMIPALNAGKFDAIMAGMSVTPKREEAILFSNPYGSTGQTFAVLKDSPLAKLPDTGKVFHLSNDEAGALAEIEKLKPLLKGKIIGVQTSTINGAFLEKYMKGIVEVREYKTTEQHDLDLAAGRVDLIMASMAYLSTVSKKAGNEEMVVVGPRFQGGIVGKGSAIGLRKSDTELKAKFDRAIAEANADGTIKALGEKYFGFDVSVR